MHGSRTCNITGKAYSVPDRTTQKTEKKIKSLSISTSLASKPTNISSSFFIKPKLKMELLIKIAGALV